MKYLIIRHAVADFEKWKPHYDDHAAAREAAGLVEKEVLRDLSNPNQLLLLFEMQDLAKAKELLGSASIREAMQKGGVIGTPEISFLQR